MDKPLEHVVIQDNCREILLRELFGLRSSGEGREGTDAVDKNGHPFELKSTTKNGVSTARDVGIRTISRWKRRYWICAKGINLKSGFKIDEMYLLHPLQLNSWITRLERDILDDEKFIDYLLRKLELSGVGHDDLMRLKRISKRGVTRNDPNIPWKYIQAHGDLVVGCPKEFLLKWIKSHPLNNTEMKLENNKLIEMVCGKEEW